MNKKKLRVLFIVWILSLQINAFDYAELPNCASSFSVYLCEKCSLGYDGQGQGQKELATITNSYSGSFVPDQVFPLSLVVPLKIYVEILAIWDVPQAYGALGTPPLLYRSGEDGYPDTLTPIEPTKSIFLTPGVYYFGFRYFEEDPTITTFGFTDTAVENVCYYYDSENNLWLPQENPIPTYKLIYTSYDNNLCTCPSSNTDGISLPNCLEYNAPCQTPCGNCDGKGNCLSCASDSSAPNTKALFIVGSLCGILNSISLDQPIMKIISFKDDVFLEKIQMDVSHGTGIFRVRKSIRFENDYLPGEILLSLNFKLKDGFQTLSFPVTMALKAGSYILEIIPTVSAVTFGQCGTKPIIWDELGPYQKKSLTGPAFLYTYRDLNVMCQKSLSDFPINDQGCTRFDPIQGSCITDTTNLHDGCGASCYKCEEFYCAECATNQFPIDKQSWWEVQKIGHSDLVGSQALIADMPTLLFSFSDIDGYIIRAKTSFGLDAPLDVKLLFYEGSRGFIKMNLINSAYFYPPPISGSVDFRFLQKIEASKTYYAGFEWTGTGNANYYSTGETGMIGFPRTGSSFTPAGLIPILQFDYVAETFLSCDFQMPPIKSPNPSNHDPGIWWPDPYNNNLPTEPPLLIPSVPNSNWPFWQILLLVFAIISILGLVYVMIRKLLSRFFIIKKRPDASVGNKLFGHENRGKNFIELKSTDSRKY